MLFVNVLIYHGERLAFLRENKVRAHQEDLSLKALASKVGKAQRIRFATRKKEKTHNFQTSLLNGTLLSGSSTETLAAENAQSHVGFLVSCSTQQEPNYRGTSSKTRCGEQEQKSVQRGGSVAFAWWTIRTL